MREDLKKMRNVNNFTGVIRYGCKNNIIAMFDYPKNLTLFDTECKKVLGSSLLIVCFDYGVCCATFDLP